jgi:hypothetical protein
VVQLRKAAAATGGLQAMSDAELRAVLTKVGYPHALEALVPSKVPLPSLEEVVADRPRLTALLKSVSFTVMVAPTNTTMDTLRTRMSELRAVMDSPLMHSVQTMFTVWATIKETVAGLFNTAASDGAGQSDSNDVVGKLLERIMAMLQQSEVLQPALQKLRQVQSSLADGVVGSTMTGELTGAHTPILRLHEGSPWLRCSAKDPLLALGNGGAHTPRLRLHEGSPWGEVLSERCSKFGFLDGGVLHRAHACESPMRPGRPLWSHGPDLSLARRCRALR